MYHQAVFTVTGTTLDEIESKITATLNKLGDGDWSIDTELTALAQAMGDDTPRFWSADVRARRYAK